MKKTQEIIGLPIISISDGMEAGKVKSIIINADKGAIDYIIVDSGIQILSVRVIPTGNILGIGEYALTIENEGAINDISKIPSAIDLLQKNIQVKGTKVLTKKGRLIGEIGDIFIDENDCCSIVGLEFIADITQKKIRIIPRDSVITFGKDLIVVKDDVESNLLDRAAQLDSAGVLFEGEKKNTVNEEYYEETAAVLDNIIPNNTVPGADSMVQPVQSVPSGSTGDSAASLFEQRQRQYLIGRTVTKTIVDNYGNVIINEGMPINEEVIDEAKGKGKLIELVMNNKA